MKISGMMPKPLADKDGRRNARIAHRRPVGRIGPLRHGDHVARGAVLQVLAVDIGRVFQGRVDDLAWRSAAARGAPADSAG